MTKIRMEANRIRAARADRWFNVILGALCVLMGILIFYPMYFVCIASISNPASVANGSVWLFPVRPTLIGYREIFKDMRIWTGYRNTLIYSVGGMLTSMLITIPAGYALSRRDFKARRVLMLYFTLTMFFSGGIIPTYITVKQFRLDNSIWVMLIPFSLNVYNLIITRTFLENTIPTELLEAARLDGCSDIRFLISIVLPLSRAMLAVISLYYLVSYWNEYFKALMYLRSDNLAPLQIVLRDILIRNQSFATGGLAMGASADGSVQQKADLVKFGVIVVASLPIIIIYPFIQKYFEKGVMIGSLKG